MHGLFTVNPYSRIMTCGERIIAISETSNRYILESYPKTDPDIVRVIPRGIDPTHFRHGYQPDAKWSAQWNSDHPELAGKFVITLPGRMTHKKGQHDLVQIVALLKKAQIPAHGILVGNTHPRKVQYLESIRELITREGVDDDITILQHRHDVREIMAFSDVVVALTHQPEAFGRVPLEGICLGKPVIAYHQGGFKEQLDYFFPEGAVPPNDIDAVAKLLESWYRSGPPLPSLKIDHPFTLQAMLESTLAVYEELLSSR
jgi:glycosyltransferase involved in cell wall biosynthesis